MIHSKTAKAVSLFLSVIMLLGMLPMTALAAWADTNVVFDGTSFGTNGYYNVISKKDYVLVPGAATETEMVLNNAAGTRRQVLHIVEVDPSNPDISIIPGYNNIDKDIHNVDNQTAAKVTAMTSYYEDQLGYNVVAGMNTALAYDSNAPIGFLVYNGEVLSNNLYHTSSTFLAVYKNEDGTCYCELRETKQGLRGDEWQAIAANFAMTVKDGVLLTGAENRTAEGAARSMIGIKPDGTLVLCMNDGRGANNSIGLNNYELGEAMLALGCQWALNCDGGGSSSIVTKRVGEDEFTMRSVPCDGAERPTIHSVFIVSNVAPTGELGQVNVESGYDYFAPETTYTFGAQAVDTHGYAMDMPANATWALSDASFGTITGGTFISNGTRGTVDVQVLVDGTVVGSKTIHVADPTTLSLRVTSTVLPYSTADKPRTTTLPIVAKVGEADVYYDTHVFAVTTDNAAAGTLSGFDFTATTDTTVTGVNVNAFYMPMSRMLTYRIEFGKGSEVLWDFENGERGGFVGQQEALAWQTANGTNPFVGVNGQTSPSVISESFIATRENGGKVHGGDMALGFRFDMTQVGFNDWIYANVFQIGDSYVLRDVANDQKATTLGMWVYIPYGFHTDENDGSLAMRFDLMAGSSAASLTRKSFDATYNGKKINALAESDIPDNRWIYASIDLTAYNYIRTADPCNGLDGFSPSLIRMYVKPSVAQVLTYYFDDITLDYSSAVDDRTPPAITEPTYAVSDVNVSLEGMPTITAVSSAFAAIVSDDGSGIDPTTAAIYVDGNPVETVSINGNAISCDSVAVSGGTHTVVFEIADLQGNYSTLTRQFVSQGTDASMGNPANIVLEGHNDSGEMPMPGSVYYIDVKNSFEDSFGSGVFTLKLHSANTWILDQITVNPDFAVSYEVNAGRPNEVTFTVTTVNLRQYSRAPLMFSVPVRVYNPSLISEDDGGTVSGRRFVAPLTVELTDCTINGSRGNSARFVVESLEGLRTITRHEHDAQLSVMNMTATCQHDGYTGRTYCETCRSVVDWGETIKSEGHDYTFVDGGFVCSLCDDVLATGTGLVEMGGKTYYSIADKLVTGWQDIDGLKYYFDKATYEGLNGVYKSSEVCTTSQKFEYSFTNGKLDSGVWVAMPNGMRYYYGNSHYGQGIYVIDGETYGFDPNGYRYEGLRVIKWNPHSAYQLFEYTAEGVYVGERRDNGVFTTSNGQIYYLTDGIASMPGLVLFEGDYYFFGHGYMTARLDGQYYIAAGATNGLLPAGTYAFGKDGKMLRGVAADENGNIRYYVNGRPVYAGLVQDDNGDYYYISGSTLCAEKNTTRYVSMTNDLLPKGNYTFGEDGKLVQGVRKDAAGHVRYYVNGQPTYAGLVQDADGAYYYISGSTLYAETNTTRYISFTNDLLPKGTYTFGEDGKMLQGIVKDTAGNVRYYVNGQPTYAGLVQDADGAYYYISGSTLRAEKNTTRYISFTNGLLPKGTYTFGADGKMTTRQGVVRDADGTVRYYENDKPVYAGLVQDNFGDYYYISGSTLRAVTNTTRYITFTNGLLPNGTYSFGADGKMIVNAQ